MKFIRTTANICIDVQSWCRTVDVIPQFVPTPKSAGFKPSYFVVGLPPSIAFLLSLISRIAETNSSADSKSIMCEGFWIPHVAFKDTLALPSAPFLVVIKITPFAAREP